MSKFMKSEENQAKNLKSSLLNGNEKRYLSVSLIALQIDLTYESSYNKIKSKSANKAVMQNIKIPGYTVIKLIGQGGYGKVYQVKNQNGEIFAAKLITYKDQAQQDECWKQIFFASSLEHKNIIDTQLVTALKKQKSLLMVTEICEDGDLTQSIGKLNQLQCANLFKQIVDGMVYLHVQKNLVHRDIKPENILMKSGIPKIADFGLVSRTKQNGVTTNIGTLKYMAPEVMNNSKYDKPSDIWSLGITFLELVLGSRIQMILGGSMPPASVQGFPNNTIMQKIKDQKMRNLIKRMLTKSPLNRIVIQQMQTELDTYLRQKQTQAAQKILKGVLKKFTVQKEQVKINESLQIKNLDQKDFLNLFNNYQKFPNLLKIILIQKEISDKGLETLVQISQKCPCLQQIDFSYNKISNKGLAYFANNISICEQVQKIIFDGNQISNSGLNNLVKNAKKFPNLQIISLNNNKISNQGLIAIANNSSKLPNLKKISLSSNQISDQGLENFAMRCCKLLNFQQIYLNDNKISDKGLGVFAYRCSKFPNLRRIYFNGNKISDDGWADFANNSSKFFRLQTIYMRKNNITDAGLIDFAQNSFKFPHLKQIYIGGNKISDAGLKAFANKCFKFPELELIDLDQNKFSMQQLNNLSSNTNMFYNPFKFQIPLYENDDEEQQQYENDSQDSSFQDNSPNFNLDPQMGFNPFGQVWKSPIIKQQVTQIPGYTIKKLLGSDYNSKDYQVVNYNGQRYAAKIITFSDQDKQMEFLKQSIIFSRLNHKNILNVESSIQLKKQKSTAIIMEFCEEGKLTNIIGKTNQFQCVNLIKQIVDGIAYLHIQKNLVHRDIKPEKILMKSGVPKLISFTSKKVTNQNSCISTNFGTYQYFGPQVFESQKFNKPSDIWSLGITFLEIILGKRIHLIIQRSSPPAFINDFPSNKLMNQIKDEIMRDLIKKMLIRDPLKRIKIQQIQILLESYLKKKQFESSKKPEKKNLINESLQITNVNEYNFLKLMNDYQQFPKLQKIALGNNQISDDSLISIGKNTKKFSNLQKIHLNGNSITDTGLTGFANSSTKLLKLSQIYLSSNQIENNGLISFANNFSKFPNLQQIAFFKNKISDQGFVAFANNTKYLPNLKKIYFSVNKISDQGFIEFANKSATLPKLQYIGINNNQISDNGLISFAINSSKFLNLQTIYMNTNKISDKGLTSFAQKCSNLPNLQKLFLSGNQLQDDGLSSFAEKGEKFPNLKQIDFSKNKISSMQLGYFAKDSKLFNLQKIDLQGNKIQNEGFKAFAKHGSKFPKLKQIDLSSNRLKSQQVFEMKRTYNLQFFISL